jgi:hypothetical protein
MVGDWPKWSTAWSPLATTHRALAVCTIFSGARHARRVRKRWGGWSWRCHVRGTNWFIFPRLISPKKMSVLLGCCSGCGQSERGDDQEWKLRVLTLSIHAHCIRCEQRGLRLEQVHATRVEHSHGREWQRETRQIEKIHTYQM